MNLTSQKCSHQPVVMAGIEVVACPECGSVEWLGPTRSLDPSEGMAALFGGYRLIGKFPAVRAPGPEVLLYRPSSRKSKEHLQAFPTRVWLQVDDHLWLSHDHENLLLIPTSPVLMENLTRGA